MKRTIIGLCVFGLLIMAGTALGPQQITSVISQTTSYVSQIFTGTGHNTATTLTIRVKVRGNNN